MLTVNFSNSGQSALIIGAGPIGLAVLLCLKAFGAKTILISEIAAMRKAQAEKFGVDAVLDPTQVDVVNKAKELIDGYYPIVCANEELVHMSHLTARVFRLPRPRRSKPYARGALSSISPSSRNQSYSLPRTF